MDSTPQDMSVVSASSAALAAIMSAGTAFLSYRLSRAIRDETKSDERIVVGKISHANLQTRAHARCVLQVPLFNKSKRKACITALTAYDSSSKEIRIAWSEAFDTLGNILAPGDLVAITDVKTIHIRRIGGEPFTCARLLFTHSFSEEKEIAIFDSVADFMQGD